MLQLLLGAAVGAAATPAVTAAAMHLQKTISVRPAGQVVWVVGVAAAVTGAAVAALPGGGTTIAVYAVFAAAILTAAVVDAAEQRIPDVITYPLTAGGILGLPWLPGHYGLWAFLGPLVGAIVSGLFALLSALIDDQGLGDVKLAAAIGAWMAHLGVVPWAAGVAFGQILMVAVVGGAMLHRRRRGLPHALTALAPALTAGAVIAVALAGTSM